MAPPTETARSLGDYADELRTSAADELDPDPEDTDAQTLLGATRAIGFALLEIGARLELLEQELEVARSERPAHADRLIQSLAAIADELRSLS